MLFFDPLYLVMILPVMALSGWAAWSTRARFERWAQVPNQRRIRGAEAARYILDRNGLHDVRVVMARGGALSDHYDPAHREVRLSPEVFHGGSVSAVAVAAHETGHALQHARGYVPLALRSLAVPLASVGSNLGLFVILVGALLSLTQLVWVGILLFAGTVVFQLITLPVELDASARARAELEGLGLVTSPGEARGVRQVLSAAAMTYVAAALGSIMTLAYYVLRLGGLGERR